MVIDAMSSAGCPSDGADVLPWWDAHVKPFQPSTTVLLGDHRPKRSEDRAMGGIGSVHKRSFLTGVSLLLDGIPWTQHTDGRLTLTNHKDRHGVLTAGIGKKVGAVVGKHVDGVLTITVEPPTDKERGADLTERVVNALTIAEPEGIRTATKLATAVGCKRQALDKVLPMLVEAGAIEKVEDGKADLYRIAREDSLF